jgi:hypothetical protein
MDKYVSPKPPKCSSAGGHSNAGHSSNSVWIDWRIIVRTSKFKWASPIIESSRLNAFQLTQICFWFHNFVQQCHSIIICLKYKKLGTN